VCRYIKRVLLWNDILVNYCYDQSFLVKICVIFLSSLIFIQYNLRYYNSLSMFLFEFYNIIFELKRQSGDITDVVSIFVTYIIFVQLILQSIFNFRNFRSKYHKIVCHFKKRWPKIFYVSVKTLLKRIYDFSESKKESLLHIKIISLLFFCIILQLKLLTIKT